MTATDTGEPVVLRSASKHPDYIVADLGMAIMSYRMGLAQTCKQLRAEYLPIYGRLAAVSICTVDLDAYLAAFYPAGNVDLHELPSLNICICHCNPCRALFDILPLLKIRMDIPDAKIRFHADAKCAKIVNERGHRDWAQHCTDMNSFLKLDNPAWQAELKKGTFTKVDMSYMLEWGHADVGLELADSSSLDVAERLRLHEVLKPLGDISFCVLVESIRTTAQGWGLTYRHEDSLYP